MFPTTTVLILVYRYTQTRPIQPDVFSHNYSYAVCRNWFQDTSSSFQLPWIHDGKDVTKIIYTKLLPVIWNIGMAFFQSLWSYTNMSRVCSTSGLSVFRSPYALIIEKCLKTNKWLFYIFFLHVNSCTENNITYSTAKQ